MTTNRIEAAARAETKRCAHTMYGLVPSYSHPCGRKMWKMGAGRFASKLDPLVPLCKIHHPEAKEARRISRGPTKNEVRWANADMARIHRQEQEAQVKALREALAGLRDIVVERERGNHDLDEELDAADVALKDVAP